MAADIAVIVVTYNSAEVVESLLDSVGPALDGTRADVVVVDNDSTDGTRQLVERRSDCILVPAPNLGYAAGFNTGLEHTSSEAVLLLNPDLVLAPGSVPPLLERLSTPGCGVVAPKVLDSDGSLFPSLRREPTLARALGLGFTGRPAFAEHVTEPAAYSSAHPVDWALGAALLMSRRCLDAVGQWDPTFFLYSEETEFCLRARDAGFSTWFEPLSEVVHAGGGSGQSDTTHVMQIVNRVRLYGRRHGSPSTTAYLLLSMLSEASWILRGHPQSKAALRALADPRRRPAELGLGGRLLPR